LEIREHILGLIQLGWTNKSIAKNVESTFDIETTDDSIRRFRKRHQVTAPAPPVHERSYTTLQGDEAEASTSSRERPYLDDPDKMLLDRGLDPEEWFIDTERGVQLNEWGNPDGTMNYQVKFLAKKFHPQQALEPVRSDGWKPPFKVPSWHLKSTTQPRLVVICGDQQAPFHDQDLNTLFCEWLATNEPDQGVILGDFIDLPDLSRHPSDPENHANAQECLQSGYDLARAYVQSSVNTQWEYMPGNHDERIRQYLVAKAPRAYDLARVNTPTDPGNSVYSLSHLMRLDELDINFVEPYGGYEDCQVELSKNLAVRHGWVVRQGSGASALKTLEQTGYSIIVGHTHRQSIVHHTVHDIDRNATTLLAAEAGCMCRITSHRDGDNRRFPAYSVMPDWQQGFCTASVYPDGKFRVDLATYVNGTLLWRDQRYSL
jgi:hypothetical protein